MADQKLVDMIRAGGGYKADLNGADLRGADLRRADLRGAQMIRADLTDADLEGANLNSARLDGAKLNAANLERASLLYTNLERAQLENAQFHRAVMDNAKLQGADLYNADLTSASLVLADLRYAGLSSADLTGADLDYTDLKGVVFDKQTKWPEGIRTESGIVFRTAANITVMKFDYKGQNPNDRLKIDSYEDGFDKPSTDTMINTIGEFIQANEDPDLGKDILALRKGKTLEIGGGAGVGFKIMRMDFTPPMKARRDKPVKVATLEKISAQLDALETTLKSATKGKDAYGDAHAAVSARIKSNPNSVDVNDVDSNYSTADARYALAFKGTDGPIDFKFRLESRSVILTMFVGNKTIELAEVSGSDPEAAFDKLLATPFASTTFKQLLGF